ncbi:MAG: protein phosphatase 2C domain-containing protein [Hyphomicrobiaceae bacterium]|nr:protein phosphatase 2C domain-containing protein [Hyphomicrobiaceae bacterium]
MPHPALRFALRDAVSLASGAANEDRIGFCDPFAWVIDGATDLVDAPLGPGPTDAAWFAAAVDQHITGLAAGIARDKPGGSTLLDRLPESVATATASEFARRQKRPPAERWEYPSATLLAAALDTTGALEVLSLGDCTLLIARGRHVERLGADAADVGDRAVAADVAALQRARPMPQAASTIRPDLMPSLRARRAHLNTETGYGVLSIVPPPPRFVERKRLALKAGDFVLVASDGLMRLVDVYRAHSAGSLMDAARSRGLAFLAMEARAIEEADATCSAYPRAKARDDASGLFLEIVAGAA